VGSIPHGSKVRPKKDNWIPFQACVGNDSVVFPSHMRSVEKILKVERMNVILNREDKIVRSLLTDDTVVGPPQMTRY
jgi:hypothetical protein